MGAEYENAMRGLADKFGLPDEILEMIKLEDDRESKYKLKYQKEKLWLNNLRLSKKSVIVDDIVLRLNENTINVITNQKMHGNTINAIKNRMGFTGYAIHDTVDQIIDGYWNTENVARCSLNKDNFRAGFSEDVIPFKEVWDSGRWNWHSCVQLISHDKYNMCEHRSTLNRADSNMPVTDNEKDEIIKYFDDMIKYYRDFIELHCDPYIPFNNRIGWSSESLKIDYEGYIKEKSNYREWVRDRLLR